MLQALANDSRLIEVARSLARSDLCLGRTPWDAAMRAMTGRCSAESVYQGSRHPMKHRQVLSTMRAGRIHSVDDVLNNVCDRARSSPEWLEVLACGQRRRDVLPLRSARMLVLLEERLRRLEGRILRRKSQACESACSTSSRWSELLGERASSRAEGESRRAESSGDVQTKEFCGTLDRADVKVLQSRQVSEVRVCC